MNCDNSIKIRYPSTPVLTSNIVGFVPGVSSLVEDILQEYNFQTASSDLGDYEFNNAIMTLTSFNDMQIIAKHETGVNITSDNYTQLQWISNVLPLSSVSGYLGSQATHWFFIDYSGATLSFYDVNIIAVGSFQPQSQPDLIYLDVLSI